MERSTLATARAFEHAQKHRAGVREGQIRPHLPWPRPLPPGHAPSPPDHALSRRRLLGGLRHGADEQGGADLRGGRAAGQSHGGGGAAEEGQRVPPGAPAHPVGGGAGLVLRLLRRHRRPQQRQVRPAYRAERARNPRNVPATPWEKRSLSSKRVCGTNLDVMFFPYFSPPFSLSDGQIW